MAVPTLVLVDGFELPITWATGSTAGGGLATTVALAAGGFTHDSTIKRSGGYSLKVIQDGTNAHRITKTIQASGMRDLVGSFYFYATTAPASQSIITDSSAGPRPQFRLETDGKLNALFTGGTAQATAASICDSTWHRIDFYANTNANPCLLDWQVDGVAQTQCTRPIAAADMVTWQIGSAGTAPNATFYLDDLVLSVTAADYPIGEHTVFGILPTADGTHAAGTNTIEDNAGTDIASPNAFPILNNWPPDTAAYIRQATVSTTSYAEVSFANHDATMDVIWDCQALVSFTSSTNAANEGATVVSTDGFSTEKEVYGTGSARTNYQSSTTTALNYKVSNSTLATGVLTRPGGGWTTTLVDALTARVGYSNDVTGNPRWHSLGIQYAGTLAVGGGGSTTESVGFIPI